MTYLERVARLSVEGSLRPSEWRRFDDRHRAMAAQAWSARAGQERCSAAVFAAICHGLLAVPVSLTLSSALARIVDDELRHAELCEQMARELGGALDKDELGDAERRLRPPERDAISAAISLLLVEGAVGETISTALFAATRTLTAEPRSRSALSLILRDEARHARTCWEALDLLTGEVTRDGAALSADLSHELGVVEAHSVLPALKRVEAGDLGMPEHAALGLLPPLRRVEVFYATLEQNVFPRLRRFGIDTQSVWGDRYKCATR